MSSTTSWVVQIKAAHHLAPFWLGNIHTTTSEGRDHAKAKAVELVRKHFMDARIIGIARGSIEMNLAEDPAPVDIVIAAGMEQR